MDIQSLRRPIANALSSRTQCLFAANISTRRNESSYRRTKKRLNVKPEPSFDFNKSSPQQDHIVFNPPSSAPSVLHTPLKFLPKDDPRRKLFASAATSTLAPANTKLAPEIFRKPTGYQRHHLSEADVAEIRRLQATNPERWTNHRLAAKFECSRLFVAMCCKATEENIQAKQEKLAAIRAKWGPKKTHAKEERVKRRQAIWRDE